VSQLSPHLSTENSRLRGGGTQSEEWWIKQAEAQEAAEASKHANREASVRKNLLALRAAARELEQKKSMVEWRMEQEMAKRRAAWEAEQQVRVSRTLRLVGTSPALARSCSAHRCRLR
jgi:hypothetical protein